MAKNTSQNSNEEPLLDLSTEREYKTIVIDEVRYRVKMPEDLSIVEQARFQGYGKTLARVSQRKGKFTEAIEKEYNKVLYDFIKMILDGIEGRIVGKLTIWQRLRVVEAFMQESKMLPPPGGATARANLKTPKKKQ